MYRIFVQTGTDMMALFIKKVSMRISVKRWQPGFSLFTFPF